MQQRGKNAAVQGDAKVIRAFQILEKYQLSTCKLPLNIHTKNFIAKNSPDFNYWKRERRPANILYVGRRLNALFLPAAKPAGLIAPLSLFLFFQSSRLHPRIPAFCLRLLV